MARASYRSPRLKEIEQGGAPPRGLDEAGEGEIVFVVGYGRVPPKEPQRIPIGLALTMFSGSLAPNDIEAAMRMVEGSARSMGIEVKE